jgi:enterochelin esterase-like enzyme
MRSLERAVARAGPQAAEDFWASVSEAPLCEPDPDCAGAWRVTFLWRGDPNPTRHVRLCGPILFSEPDGRPLRHVDGTDVWHVTLRLPPRTRTAYCLAPNGALGPIEGPDDYARRLAAWARDPLNSKALVVPLNEEMPEFTPMAYSVLEAPDAPPQPWVAERGSPSGTVQQHDFESATLGNRRRVWTYAPADRVAKQGWSPLLVAFDGWRAINVMQLPLVLDNLIAARAIPPCAAVLVDSGTTEMRVRELDCHEPFVRFLTDELMPWATQHLAVSPRRETTVLAGVSYGGRAAVHAGLRRPDVFGKVLAQATAVMTDPPIEPIVVEPATVRSEFYLDIGLLEADSPQLKGFLGGNRRLAADLRDAGHEAHLVELACGHDEVVLRDTIADGLQRLLNG